ncbi:MAG: SgcJ/EcaC family oxidoreductase [Reyranellaceae bacterium]
MNSLRRTLLRLGLAALAVSGPAMAQGDPAGEIRGALERWTAAFNARQAEDVCDLFARDLRYDFRGQPERDYAAMCAGLRKALADRSRDLRYAFEIKEILVSGDLAIVRLVWTSALRAAGAERAVVTREPGLDVFRRQADGRWRIIRYMAYEEP